MYRTFIETPLSSVLGCRVSFIHYSIYKLWLSAYSLPGKSLSVLRIATHVIVLIQPCVTVTIVFTMPIMKERGAERLIALFKVMEPLSVWFSLSVSSLVSESMLLTWWQINLRHMLHLPLPFLSSSIPPFLPLSFLFYSFLSSFFLSFLFFFLPFLLPSFLSFWLCSYKELIRDLEPSSCSLLDLTFSILKNM